MDNYISPLDSDRLGIKVARINQFPEPVHLMVNKLKMSGYGLIISRIPVDDISLVNELEQAGFRLKDIQLTYTFRLDQQIPALTKGRYLYRGLKPEDVPFIVQLAETSFENYGHYSWIDLPGIAVTKDIYSDWARRCCHSPEFADYVVVALLKTELAGFLAFKKVASQSSYAAGVMGAVHEKHRRKGVFRAINIHGLQWAKQEGLGRVEHNVLANNYQVNKTYSSLGFNIIQSAITMHCLLKH